ncbi:MAG: hypothetical protein HS113_18775 [Verrucomicrobiales bacterium]|nr:hypothetical protein [Verrucomicrobiales bacterium]
MKLQNRQQILALAAIGAFALLVGDRLVLTPLARHWNDRAARLTELQKSVNQGALLLEREAIIRSRWAAMQAACLAAEASAAENQVLKAFDRWSQASRVGVTSIKPQLKRSTSERFANLECRVDASGNLSSITRLLYDIEADPMALKLDAVEITARDDRGELLTLGLLVNGLMFKPSESP